MTQIRVVLLALGFTVATLGSLHAQVLASGGFLTNDAFCVLVTGVPAGAVWRLQTTENLTSWTDLSDGSLQPGDNVVVDPAPVLLRLYRASCETSSPPYSVNVVGFIKLNVPTGFKMIANQLVRRGNPITTLLGPPEGTTLYRFNPATGGYVSDTYVDGAWEAGDNAPMPLDPGEGAFIHSPTAWVLKLDGEVLLCACVDVPDGFSISASPCPVAGSLDGFVPNGLSVYQFNPATGGYLQNSFIDGAWEGDSGGATPQLSVGESFFMYNPHSLLSWGPLGRLQAVIDCP